MTPSDEKDTTLPFDQLAYDGLDEVPVFDSNEAEYNRARSIGLQFHNRPNGDCRWVGSNYVFLNQFEEGKDFISPGQEEFTSPFYDEESEEMHVGGTKFDTEDYIDSSTMEKLWLAERSKDKD